MAQQSAPLAADPRCGGEGRAPDKPVQTHVAYSAIVGNRINGGLSNEVVDEFQFARRWMCSEHLRSPNG